MSRFRRADSSPASSLGNTIRNLPLRIRVLVAVLVVWSVLLAALQGVLSAFIKPSFVALEAQYARDDLGRVEGAFAHDLETLGQAAKDYGVWDEMYAFAKKPNAEFIATNLPDNVLGTLKIDLLSVYDANEQAVFVKAADPSSGVTHDFLETNPEQFKARFPILVKTHGGGLIESLKRAGTVRLVDGRLLEVVAYPIVKSTNTGPAVGTVVMGRLIGDSLQNDVRQRTKVAFELDTKTALNVAHTDDNPQVSAGVVSVSALWQDAFQRPMARLRLSRPASIVEQGRQTLAVAMFSTGAVLSTVLLILLAVLQFTVVIPLGELSQAIEGIQVTGNLDKRLSLKRGDEIGTLAKGFDGLLTLLGERAEKLQQLATVDELTDVLNRRAIMDFLHREIERAIRYEHGLATLLLDIDYFKRINDTDGHAVGDRVLRNLARVLMSTLRETDRVGRYGGEEFLVVMPHQTQEGAEIAAERLRAAVETAQGLGASWTVTVSIGVAYWEGHSREGLLYIADKNLYCAKNEGRNRYVARKVPLSDLPLTSVAGIRVRSKHSVVD